MLFKLNSKFLPSGDQPQAIEKLTQGILDGKKDQVLLGITGSGKTFTMANVIAKLQRPAIIMAHNKTLAAQLYAEMKEFFPENSVEYFISYYDYYQPEAYLPSTDTYIEKDSAINEEIDKLRHSTTKSLFERKDVIIIASVSAIYGLGEPDNYSSMKISLNVGEEINIEYLCMELVRIQYQRTDENFSRGKFRLRGDILYIFPPSSDEIGIMISFFENEIEEICEFEVMSGKKINQVKTISIYPNGHHVAPLEKVKSAIEEIKKDLEERINFLKSIGKDIEAHRIGQKTRYDLMMMLEVGYCKGIENYSRYLTGRPIGSSPPTLFEYIPKNALLFVDESHVTTPQIKAMYNGDRARKQTLIEFGFRLPSAFDNRPLKYEEWDNIRPQTIFISATPGKIELEKTNGEVITQIIRPTGLLDPICEIRPVAIQVEDTYNEILIAKEKGQKVLCITVTKKYSERLNEYFVDKGIKSMYLHSEIESLERISIIKKLRNGEIDVIIGINLLREGLDIPECGLVAIMDADKEGFLRSETSLIQIIGRAARNINGKVILYADKITKAIESALKQTNERRKIQKEYNEKNNIQPMQIIKKVENIFDDILEYNKSQDHHEVENKYHGMNKENLQKEVKKLEKEMKKAAKLLEFDLAIQYRDLIALAKKELNSK